MRFSAVVSNRRWQLIIQLSGYLESLCGMCTLERRCIAIGCGYALLVTDRWDLACSQRSVGRPFGSEPSGGNHSDSDDQECNCPRTLNGGAAPDQGLRLLWLRLRRDCCSLVFRCDRGASRLVVRCVRGSSVASRCNRNCDGEEHLKIKVLLVEVCGLKQFSSNISTRL